MEIRVSKRILDFFLIGFVQKGIEGCILKGSAAKNYSLQKSPAE